MAGQMSSSIPHFYNANAVNPLKIASKEEKRKLLWGDTKVYFVSSLDFLIDFRNAP